MAKKSLADQLAFADCNKYVEVESSLLPEIFAVERPKRESMHPKGGCPGLSVSSTSTINAEPLGNTITIL